jgi:hypothetical protein
MAVLPAQAATVRRAATLYLALLPRLAVVLAAEQAPVAALGVLVAAVAQRLQLLEAETRQALLHLKATTAALG